MCLPRECIECLSRELSLPRYRGNVSSLHPPPRTVYDRFHPRRFGPDDSSASVAAQGRWSALNCGRRAIRLIFESHNGFRHESIRPFIMAANKGPNLRIIRMRKVTRILWSIDQGGPRTKWGTANCDRPPDYSSIANAGALQSHPYYLPQPLSARQLVTVTQLSL